MRRRKGNRGVECVGNETVRSDECVAISSVGRDPEIAEGEAKCSESPRMRGRPKIAVCATDRAIRLATTRFHQMHPPYLFRRERGEIVVPAVNSKFVFLHLSRPYRRWERKCALRAGFIMPH